MINIFKLFFLLTYLIRGNEMQSTKLTHSFIAFAVFFVFEYMWIVDISMH